MLKVRSNINPFIVPILTIYVSSRYYPRTDIAPAASIQLKVWQEEVGVAVNTNFPHRSDCDRVIAMSSPLSYIANHRRSLITGFHCHGLGNLFRREKMLEILGGFSVDSRLGGGREKRSKRRSKAGKKSGVFRVRELPAEGKWCDTSARVVIVFCTSEFRSRSITVVQVT